MQNLANGGQESSDFTSVNPTTGEVLKRFETLSDQQTGEKLDRAVAAFAVYRQVPFAERSRMLLRVAGILEHEKEVLARLATTEMGKLLRLAREEVAKCAGICRYYANEAERFLRDEFLATAASCSYVRYEPMGPLLAVMPWNYPFFLFIRFAAPALMAGNVCLLKHAPNVPQCAQAIEGIFLRAGFPVGVVQTLFIATEKVEQLVSDRRVVAATLTGGVDAGRHVAVAAARCIKKVVLELGSNDPFIIMPSADVADLVGRAVEARIINNGQSCIAAKRFIVAEPVADEFEKGFVERMQKLRVGDPMDAATELGPLATGNVFNQLDRQVRESIVAGCRVLVGGPMAAFRGNFYAPTILTEIPRNSPAYQEELFGPVASLFRVRNIDEAIRIANDSCFGLGASVWTKDKRESQRLIDELQAGMVFVNRRVTSDPQLPFGGVKQSGYGRELGIHGIREFTNSKSVWIEDS
jgi:succinate-semialdehyde dehydrogenase / glutarate-semialdehyde dehydrogenase